MKAILIYLCVASISVLAMSSCNFYGSNPLVVPMPAPPNPDIVEPPKEVEPPAPKSEYPVAAILPDRPGYVLNPYTGNVVDVREIASGQLVRDPHDEDVTHKFRVP